MSSVTVNPWFKCQNINILSAYFLKWKQFQEFKGKGDGLNSEQLILQADFAKTFSRKIKMNLGSLHQKLSKPHLYNSF